MRSRRVLRLIPVMVAVAAAVIVSLAGSPASTVARKLSRVRAPLTRYSLVHGCYSLRSHHKPLAKRDGPFRMQPAALGIYLLYGPRGDYLTSGGGSSTATTATPTTAAEWRVSGTARRGFRMKNAATHARFPVKFVRARHCASYPEARIDARGRTFKGSSPEASVLGTVEGHAHVTAFDFLGGDWHCGRPWSPFGAPYALPASCAGDEQGTNGEFEAFVDFGGPSRPSDMHGWPTFREWPSPTALAEEGDYYTGIERAWKAGLRVMVTQLVDNQALCSLMTKRHNPCHDMDDVKIQSRDLYALQNYIDAQSGGPGKGWFRVVKDPFQARRVINQGKLAVVEGIEMSEVFGCGEYNDVPQCNQSQIDAGLKEAHALGVRTFFPIHEFNNAFGGTKMIAGELGNVVNAGNKKETGSFWTVQSCPAKDQDAEQTSVPHSGPIAQVINGPLASLTHGSQVPVYGPGPQCNVRGLTTLGSYVINKMIKEHFIIQLDHMDSKTATAALAIAEAHRYAGVVSAHCCSSPQLFQRIYRTGGFITPPVQPVSSFVSTWRSDKAIRDGKYHFGFGFGSDMNGLADQPGPSSGTPISYPFKSYLGRVTFSREQWGQRTFDLNRDGLANYGMYADWLRNLQLAGGRPIMSDMFQGAEAYLEMWERADGVPANRCERPDQHLTRSGLGRTLRLGDSARAALYRAGQPRSRRGRSFRYCVRGAHGTPVASVFNARGKVALIASTARGDSAGGVSPGSRATRIGRGAHRLSSGLLISAPQKNGTRFVYGIGGGRVSFIAVASHSEAASPSRLRADLRSAGV